MNQPNNAIALPVPWNLYDLILDPVACGMKWSYVYVIHCEATGLYKIGYSHNVAERMAALQAMSAFPLRLHTFFTCYVPLAPMFEGILHNTFRTKRAHGEWFKLDAEDLEMFDANVPLGFLLERGDKGGRQPALTTSSHKKDRIWDLRAMKQDPESPSTL